MTYLEEQKKLQKDRKNGRAFNVANGVIFDEVSLINSAYIIDVGIIKMPPKKGYFCIKMAFAICSPHDSYSKKIARGIIGQRLEWKDKLYYEEVFPEWLNDKGMINALILCKIISLGRQNAKWIPKKLAEACK